MPTNIKIIHAHEFLRATPEGKLDFNAMENVLKEIASAEAPAFNYDVILDTRKTQSVLSVAELWHLAAELSSLRKAFSRKTAVLCPEERFDSAQFFALCAQNRGLQIMAFTSFEAAIDWLLGEGSPPDSPPAPPSPKV